MKKLTLLLCDDHPVLRSGISAVLASHDDLEVIGQAADGEQAVKLAAELQPDVIVMDVSMPRMDGIEATARIKAARPTARILALTVHEDSDYVHRLLEAGASGYVLKRSAAEDLGRAIHSVAAGGLYLDPRVADQVLAGLRGFAGPGASGAPGQRARLSEREAQILRHLAAGFAMKEIGVKLDLSVRTLETYKARAMEKLGISSRAEIVDYALKQGWLNDA